MPEGFTFPKQSGAQKQRVGGYVVAAKGQTLVIHKAPEDKAPEDKELAALELTRDYAKVSGPRALHPANRASHVWMYYAAVPCSSCCTCSQSVALARYGIG